MAKAKKATKKSGVKPTMKKAAKAAKKPAQKAKAPKKASKPVAKAKLKAKKPAAAKAAPKKTTPKKAVKKATPAKTMSKPSARKVGGDLRDFVTPLDDRVLIRIAEMERKTAGGLFIPDTAADVSGNLEGVIVAVGRGHRDGKGRVRPMDVRLGDRVVFSQYAGAKIPWQNEELLILRESELMGILD